MQDQMNEINALQASFCAAIGDANRVRIIYELADGPSNVKSLSKTIGLSPSATSRHLKVLRDKDFVDAQRQGHSVIYSLAAPELINALDILINILNKQLAHRANLVQMERYNEGE
ncbi:MAG: metalloregulator ArsR/SmtB family transcription factor [Anaerolineales bacterium]|jgi:ArsR family transcriptional regulator